jgi:hypothetical protein
MEPTLTRRERLIRCYHHQEIDRPAVYSRTGYPVNDPTYDRLRAYLEQHTELKTMWSGVQFETRPTVENAVEPYSEDFERRIELLHTPRGTLRQTALRSLKGQPGLHETRFIKSPEDAEAYLSLPMPTFGGDASSYFIAGKAIGDAGIVDVALGHNPAGRVVDLCGSETFAMMSLTDRHLLHALCERQLTIMLQRITFLAKAGITASFGMAGQEYLVPPLHGWQDFNDFNVKYDKPIIDLIHELGGRVHVHCHGSLKRVFQGFLDMGADVLHPIEPPPMGDLPAAEAKRLAGGRICLEGNIQISRLYEVTADEIRHETETLIADAFGDRRGLIVSPTASPYIRGKGEECFPQYKAMVDAVLEYGK